MVLSVINLSLVTQKVLYRFSIVILLDLIYFLDGLVVMLEGLVTLIFFLVVQILKIEQVIRVLILL